MSAHEVSIFSCEVYRLSTSRGSSDFPPPPARLPLGLFRICIDVRRFVSTTLHWVHGLQPDDLEKFLAEKKEQRLRVLCLDLEPTGIPQQVRVCVCVFMCLGQSIFYFYCCVFFVSRLYFTVNEELLFNTKYCIEQGLMMPLFCH